ncbi:MarR family transcriptional regulator [Actinacidiphila alni]|uniref:MarR family winged helix-turn-helix transcriptional regulator n=1 Tax=Actinacidiphila alni TaxID=380248 RepID=UPI0033FFA0A4
MTGSTAVTSTGTSAKAGTGTGEERPEDGAVGPADAVYALVSTLVRHSRRDVSLTSASALATLRRTGPRRITDLAAIEGVTQPSVTALVTSLERAGLVERRSDPADRRVVLVALTDAGLDYLTERRRSGVEVFARLVDRLPADEAAALAAAVPALERLRALDDAEREPATPS